jgi:ribosomal protein L40E
MPQETLGYTELEWVCPSCQTRNPGLVKTCKSCGAAQPPDVEFIQPVREELIKDEKKLAAAQAGPDIHCPYCGARNPGGTAVCTNCGGDLKEGKVRAAGQVLGAHRTGPAMETACPNCGELNADTAANCKKCGAPLTPPPATLAPAPKQTKLPLGCIIALGAAALLIIVFIVMATNTETLVGTVQSGEWQRIIAIQEIGPVAKEDFRTNIPTGAQIQTCGKSYYGMSDSPAPDSTQVCGTPYTINQGSGAGKVVQDCQYRVYKDYCKYTVEEWKTINQIVARGSDLNPVWPAQPSLTNKQRLGDQTEQYKINFNSNKGNYTYTTNKETVYKQAAPGTRWTLTVNGLGDLVKIELAP